MPHTLLAKITYAVFAAISLFALWQGGRWERVSGAVLLFVTIITPLIQDRVRWMDPEARLLTLDVLLLVFFLGFAITFGRLWMIFAAAFQLLSTLSHPAAHFAAHIGPSAYLAIFELFSYGVYLSLGLGVLAERLHQRQLRSRLIQPARHRFLRL